MAGDSVASTSGDFRPQLKGRHAAFMKKHLAIAIGTSLLSVALAKHFINDKRKLAYAEYYRNYDIEKDFIRIKNLGWFSSCGPED